MRRLFTFFSGLLLLLCIGSVYFWVRTSGEPFEWEWVSTKGLEDRAWQHGELKVGLGRVGYVTFWPEPKCTQRYFKPSRKFRTMTPTQFAAFAYQYDPWTSRSLSQPGPLNERDYWWRGVQYARVTDPLNRVTSRQMWLPFWLIASVLFLLPLIRGLMWFRSMSRSRQGCCSSCGYSLTGNTSGTCPECGSPISKSSRPGDDRGLSTLARNQDLHFNEHPRL